MILYFREMLPCEKGNNFQLFQSRLSIKQSEVVEFSITRQPITK